MVPTLAEAVGTTGVGWGCGSAPGLQDPLEQEGGYCARKPGLAKGNLYVPTDGQPVVIFQLGRQEPSKKCSLLGQPPDAHTCPSVSPGGLGTKLGVGFLTKGKGTTDLPPITPAAVPTTANTAWLPEWEQWGLRGGLGQKVED